MLTPEGLKVNGRESRRAQPDVKKKGTRQKTRDAIHAYINKPETLPVVLRIPTTRRLYVSQTLQQELSPEESRGGGREKTTEKELW